MALLWLFFVLVLVLVLVLDAVSSITSTEHDGILWSRRPEPTFTLLSLDQSSQAICQVLPKWRGRCWMPRAQ